jgi:drug/metabolite transporter (DMT)-like permease
MVTVFALLAALCNAINEATQHVASTTAPRRASGLRLVRYLLTDRMWLFGSAAQVGAFAFQALALANGLLSVVQPLLATELVFMLVLRKVWIRQSIPAAAWGAAALACVSLTVFLISGEPVGGRSTPASDHWFVAVLACCAVAAILVLASRRGTPGIRAALAAAACGTMWALVATFIKATTETVSDFGVLGMFTHWPVYALVAGSVVAMVLQQAALHVGPLRSSQPFLVIVDPIVSIILSVWLYEEHFTTDAGVLATAAIAFTVMCLSIVLLTQTTPATMRADRAPAE